MFGFHPDSEIPSDDILAEFEEIVAEDHLDEFWRDQPTRPASSLPKRRREEDGSEDENED